MEERALANVRVCDFTGQLAGAGATRFLAAFGAEVIRIEDPTNEGRWDILRGIPPYVDERRGINLGGAFNNHNVEKLGITLNLRTPDGKALVRQLIATSDVVTENFAAGVLARMGLSYDELRAIKPGIIYVSNCGFGHSGPYKSFKTWGPSVQAISGLTFSSGLPDQPPAGWGYSYMDHTGAYYMTMAILMALYHRNDTGEGQWVDYATTEAALTLNGPALLDYTVNGRPLRRPGMPNSNRSQSPPMAPHGIYPAAAPSPTPWRGEPHSTVVTQDSPPQRLGEGSGEGPPAWIAIACRNDDDWRALASVVAEAWTEDERFATLDRRLRHEDALDAHISRWTSTREPFALAALLESVGVPATVVQSPQQRIDQDPNTAAWGLWPAVEQCEMGTVRVDGIPAHLSETDWRIARGAPCLGEHNDDVFGTLLGVDAGEISRLHEEGVL
jgi:crotonobetainyl-CoA:carnitine CoA-transferase CaiB-like acyl-CoA transferase